MKHPDPSFSSQTRDKLVSSEVTGIVQTIVYDKLGEFFEENPSVAKQIVEKALLASKAEKPARKARDLTRRKGVLEGGGLPGKLADCQSETLLSAKYISSREIQQEVQQKPVEIGEYKRYFP